MSHNRVWLVNLFLKIVFSEFKTCFTEIEQESKLSIIELTYSIKPFLRTIKLEKNVVKKIYIYYRYVIKISSGNYVYLVHEDVQVILRQFSGLMKKLPTNARKNIVFDENCGYLLLKCANHIL